jgi:hypothetical protein
LTAHLAPDFYEVNDEDKIISGNDFINKLPTNSFNSFGETLRIVFNYLGY